MDTPQIIGFAASLVLIATLASQIWKQWKSGKSEGVSPWLFAGQVIANIGMLTYSILLRDTVFIVTTSATFATACLGLVVQIRQRRAQQAKAPAIAQWKTAVGSWRQVTLSRRRLRLVPDVE